MKKSELKSIIREVLEEAKRPDVTHVNKSYMKSLNNSKDKIMDTDKAVSFVSDHGAKYGPNEAKKYFLDLGKKMKDLVTAWETLENHTDWD